MHLKNAFLALIAAATIASAQAADTPFQVKYAANVSAKTDSLINITNDGATGAPLLGPGFNSTVGDICVNVYTFAPDEQLISCCSCQVTPNGLVSLSAFSDLLSNTLTGAAETSIVVKLVSTIGTGGCGNSAATEGTLALGMLAWGTTTHGSAVTETAFSTGTLSAGEYASITGRCASIIGNGSGFGLCNSCTKGGQGAQHHAAK